MTNFKHKLGLLVKDKITGFEGILTSRTEYLTGCNRYAVQPRVLKEGNLIDACWFDEDQIEVTGQGILPENVQSKEPGKTGACTPDTPSRSYSPKGYK